MKLTHRLSVKILAIVLLVCSILVLGLSAFGIIFGCSTGMYKDASSFYETDMMEHYTLSYAYDLFWEYTENDWTENSLKSYFRDTNLNLAIASKEEPETILAEVNPFEGKAVYEHTEDMSVHTSDETTDYIVTIRLPETLEKKDYFYYYSNLFDFLLPLKTELIVILVASSLLTIALFIFLCFALGHKGETQELFLNPLDKIPFDLYLFCGITLFCVGVLLLEPLYYSFRYSDYTELLLTLTGLILLLMVLVCLAVIFSFITRFKYGKWWQNTICYRLLVVILRFAARAWQSIRQGTLLLFHALPMAWRTVLIASGVMLLNCFLLCESRWYSFFAFLAFLLNIAILAVIILICFQLQILQKAGKRLAEGDFSEKTDTSRLFWDFRKHAENLNAISDGMQIAVNKQMRSERLKTELITNLSHDIKTPLTSIINYVDLLQRAQTEEQKDEYLSVLDRQAKRLKRLTDDLLEASKASSGNMPVELRPVDIDEIFSQSLGEYSDRLAAAQLEPVVQLSAPQLRVLADGGHLWRVMDNLLSNVCKYALPNTRVYLDAIQRGNDVLISVKNISRAALNIDADELMERFVRGDIARTSEGNGLGLNIARSLVELMGGSFRLYVDGDLFKAEIRLPVV